MLSEWINVKISSNSMSNLLYYVPTSHNYWSLKNYIPHKTHKGQVCENSGWAIVFDNDLVKHQ